LAGVYKKFVQESKYKSMEGVPMEEVKMLEELLPEEALVERESLVPT
jgi:hypothetical protein